MSKYDFRVLDSGGTVPRQGIVPTDQDGNPLHATAPSTGAGAVDQSTQRVVAGGASTPTVARVNDTASSTTLLAANDARLGAAIYNDSPSTLYLKYGATASATDYTVKLFQDDYHEVFGGYTGIIDGIWSADASGAAQVTEVTA